MFKTLVLIMCLATLSKCGLEFEDDNQLKVTVYYESLCPHSMKYISTELYEAWKALDGDFYLQLIPYGFVEQSIKNNRWNFVCQHGPTECFGNKIHGCILKNEYIDDNDKMDLIACIMTYENPEIALNPCTIKFGMRNRDREIIECAESSEGDNIMAAYGYITKVARPIINSIPNIYFNDLYNEEHRQYARRNTTSTICQLANKKPQCC